MTYSNQESLKLYLNRSYRVINERLHSGCCPGAFKYNWYLWISSTLVMLMLLFAVYFCCRWKTRRPTPVIAITTWREQNTESVRSGQPNMVPCPFVIGSPPSYSSCVPPGHVIAATSANQFQPPPYGAPPGYTSTGCDSLRSTGNYAPPLYTTTDLSNHRMQELTLSPSLNANNNQPLLRSFHSAPNLGIPENQETPKPQGRLPPLQASISDQTFHKTL